MSAPARLGRRSVSWTAAATLDELAVGALAPHDGGGLWTCCSAGCRQASTPTATACASCGATSTGPARNGHPSAPGSAVLTCRACGAHFDIRRAGADVDDPTRHLEPVPLLERDGVVEIAATDAGPGMTAPDADPGALCVLLADPGGAAGTVPVRALRDVRRPASPTSIRTSSTSARRSLLCTCRPCYLLFTHDDADTRLPRGARSLPVLRDAAGTGLGRARAAGRHGLSVRQLRARPGRGLLSRARGRHRVGALACRPGSTLWRPFRACRRSSPTSRLCSCTPQDRPAGGSLPGPHRRLLRAGRPSAPALARFRRWPGRARPARRSSLRGSARKSRPAVAS